MKPFHYLLVLPLLLAFCKPADDGKSAEITRLKQRLAEIEKGSDTQKDSVAVLQIRLESAEAQISGYKVQLDSRDAQQVATAVENERLKAEVQRAVDSLNASKTEPRKIDTRSALQKAIDPVQGGGARLDSGPAPAPSPEVARVAIAEHFAGVPSEVAHRIVDFASRSFPGNSKMQDFVVNQQVKGWREMQGYARSPYGLLPKADQQGIAAQAISRFPSDFSMQAFVFTKQAEYWQKMVDYRSGSYKNLPADDKTGLLAASVVKFPGDYTMQTFTFEQEAEAWIKVDGWVKSGAHGMEDINAAKKRWGNEWVMVVAELDKK